MSVTTGFAYHCDRADCNGSVSIVCDSTEVRDRLTALGWGWSTRGHILHFCPVHNRSEPVRVAEDERILRVCR